MTWCIVDAPHFYAAAVFDGNTVRRAAPIIGYMGGMSLAYVRAYCMRKRWLLTIYHDDGTIEYAP